MIPPAKCAVVGDIAPTVAATLAPAEMDDAAAVADDAAAPTTAAAAAADNFGVGADAILLLLSSSYRFDSVTKYTNYV